MNMQINHFMGLGLMLKTRIIHGLIIPFLDYIYPEDGECTQVYKKYKVIPTYLYVIPTYMF